MRSSLNRKLRNVVHGGGILRLRIIRVRAKCNRAIILGRFGGGAAERVAMKISLISRRHLKIYGDAPDDAENYRRAHHRVARRADVGYLRRIQK